MGSGDVAPRILTSELEGGEWTVPRSGGFNSGKRAPGPRLIGGWVWAAGSACIWWRRKNSAQKEERKEGRKQSEKTTTVGASFRKLRHVRDESVRMGQT